MKFICAAPGRRTWFRIETDAEAEAETRLMRHAVEKHFRREQDQARMTYQPGPGIERDVGLKGHIARSTPLFLTLRADDGEGLATAMLPPSGAGPGFRSVIVGPENTDPYLGHADAIRALGLHLGIGLPRGQCYPYARE
ncbi:MAG: hypothetical protein SGJ21_15540 [Alphaproteobacteria bacterium]|mgnify:CR=1 FL=1|nr:hypothetical protein [Alphaproteobacteria bacterium]